jgi:ABC-type glycerol-3-phosphate transport system substrate-binding protein
MEERRAGQERVPGNRKTLSRRDFLELSGAGLAGAALLAVAGCGGEQSATGGQLELWTFADTHARWYRSMAESYKKDVNPDFELRVTEIAFDSIFDKLQVALQSGGAGAPDIADIEVGNFGTFLRGGNVPFVDLTDRLKNGEYLDRLVAAREELYSYKGETYGIEHALTPVVLYYRADIWEGAGVDPSGFETWDDYIAGAKEIATGQRKAMFFPEHEVMLRQRGGDYFDDSGNVTLDSDLSIDTMNWILDLRDRHQIATAPPDSPIDYFNPTTWSAFKEGRVSSIVGADWVAGIIKDLLPDLAGKWRVASLPAWEKGGRRTSCNGGTGACIIGTSENLEPAWNFLKHGMLTVEGNVSRYKMTNLYPPFKPAWDEPGLQVNDEYFSGQNLTALFAEVGPEVPPQYQSPYLPEIFQKFESVLASVDNGSRSPADVFKEIANEIRAKARERS